LSGSVALLRGVNVGTHHRVAMADVRAAVAAAGIPAVTTYLQSGNLVFPATAGTPAALETSIHDALRDALGIDIAVVVRTARRLTAITRGNPLYDPAIDPAMLHVGFLARPPAASAVRALANADFSPDRFVIAGTEVYLHYPSGSGRSKMTGAFFEHALGVPATARNWNVVTKLAELARDVAG